MGPGPVTQAMLQPALPVPEPVASAPDAVVATGATASGSYRPEPSWHPQLAATIPATPGASTGNPYALPPGVGVGDAAAGTRAHPFDVTLSQLATAVYQTRGGPPAGWTAVTDDQLRERGVADPAAWRNQFLGSPGNPWEFKAEIYTDGNDNFVLAYRGTSGTLDDWMNNFKQAVGVPTDQVDKYAGVALNTAVEFKRLFGTPDAQGHATSLAITGHSQGAALAAIGSLATGIPAVTFDGAGLHPQTLERIGFGDPQKARDIAEGGQIRNYALKSDLLTQLQESGPLGLMLPDALGTKIVVEPEGAAASNVFGRVAGIEFENLSPQQRAALNQLVETARNSGIPLIDPLADLAYMAVSHSPNVLTETMIQRAPWQPGYQNPSDDGKALQAIVPEALKDDYARNLHDTTVDIVGIVNTDFAQGRYVQGGFRIAGDVAEGLLNSAGDSVNRGAQTLADKVDADIDGPMGDIAAGVVRGGGSVVEFVADGVGNGVEVVADGVGFLAQKTSHWIGSLFR